MQGKLNAIKQRDIENATDVIGGTLWLPHMDVKALIDPGTSHSYIAQYLICKLNMTPTPLPYTLKVNTPLGESWLI